MSQVAERSAQRNQVDEGTRKLRPAAQGRGRAIPALSEEQRRLVGDNLGLVAVHLRRFVPGVSAQRSDREWDDLFQEGCLGLIRAAAEYQAARGIPFAAFALPRIRTAVSRALAARSKAASGVLESASLDESRSRPARTNPNRLSRPRAMPLDDARPSRDSRRHALDVLGKETVGDRLRGKYERAVRCAAEEVLARPSVRGDRDKLLRVLTDERYLVPHEEDKRSFRKIAAQTQSSYARVVQCDRHLRSAIRRALEVDPEFAELRRLAGTDPRGVDTPVDEALERILAEVGAAEFIARFRLADDARRGRLIKQLLRLSTGDDELERTIGSRIQRLPEALREQLHRESASEATDAAH